MSAQDHYLAVFTSNKASAKWRAWYAMTDEERRAKDEVGAVDCVLHALGKVACHGVDNRIVGPAFRDVAGKYAGRADVVEYLSGKIRAGGSGVWAAIPMPPQSLGDVDATLIAQWLAGGARK